MFKLFATSEQEKVCRANMEHARQLYNRQRDYEKTIADLNEAIHKDYQLVLLPETNDDIKCNWRTAHLYETRGIRYLKLNIYPDRVFTEHLRQVCTYLDVLKQEQTKMTREEAINKLGDVASKINRVALVDSLEALGLIKFDDAAFYKRASWKDCGLNKTIDFELGELEDGTYALKSHGKIVWKGTSK